MEKHKLSEYDYIEQEEFDGLIPTVMEIDGVETIGDSEVSVEMFGRKAMGNDQLETIDIEAFFNEESGEEGGEEGGDGQ